MSPLASPNVSDQDALSAVRGLSMSSELRRPLWNERWQSSPALQREFADGAHYVAYMEAVATGRCRTVARSNQSVLADGDEAAIDIAFAKDWSKDQRMTCWGTMFEASKSRQQEFRSKDIYCAFMEGTFNKRSRRR